MIDIKYGRNTKGIKKEIKEKIHQLLVSVKDEKVRNMMSKEIILTGGSIASMLLGEEVNDFDVYFKTKETTLEVAQYYASAFNKINDAQVEVKQKQKINAKGKTEDRIINYIISSGTAQENENLQKKQKTKFRPVFISENAITLSNKIQIVTRFYGEPHEIHDNYDFEHACCYYDFDESLLVTPEKALLALMSRTLIYRGSLYPISSIFRMKKFLNRGWRISAGQQLKIMWQISELDLTDYEVIKEQLTGVDQSYLYSLICATKDMKTEDINSTYMCRVIDRVFGDAGNLIL